MADADQPRLGIYGAYGYTGRLVAQEATARGLRPRLYGRSADRLHALADQLDLPCHAFALEDASALDVALREVDAVIHCAGPFEDTSARMLAACIKARAHYLDITGEYRVIEAIRRRDAALREAGIVALPGAGFDVVPSDCLLVHVARRLPGATSLELALTPVGKGAVSRGTMRTVVRQLGHGSAIRRGGELIRVPLLHRVESVDFDGLVTTCATAAWGDLASAHHSTGIGDIEVLMGVDPATLKTLRRLRWFGWTLRWPFVQWLARRQIASLPEGPTAAQREAGGALLRAEARDDDGNRVASRLATPEGYTLTAAAAVELAVRVVCGACEPGFHTPATAVGPDLVLELGCLRRDLEL